MAVKKRNVLKMDFLVKAVNVGAGTLMTEYQLSLARKRVGFLCFQTTHTHTHTHTHNSRKETNKNNLTTSISLHTYKSVLIYSL